jgi:hypothetical protein
MSLVLRYPEKPTGYWEHMDRVSRTLSRQTPPYWEQKDNALYFVHPPPGFYDWEEFDYPDNTTWMDDEDLMMYYAICTERPEPSEDDWIELKWQRHLRKQNCTCWQTIEQYLKRVCPLRTILTTQLKDTLANVYN